MLIGLVKWFDLEKGYGVIARENNEEYFLHKSNFNFEPSKLSVGTPVIFESQKDLKTNRQNAINCRLIGQLQDGDLILDYLGKTDKIFLELTLKRAGRNGSTSTYRETKEFSLIKVAFRHLIKSLNEDEVYNLITKYFETRLSAVNFIPYCELLIYTFSRCYRAKSAIEGLARVFEFFKENATDEIWFLVWTNNSWEYLNFKPSQDYEIPERILVKNIRELNIESIKRISDYSYSNSFLSRYIDSKLEFIKKFDYDEFKTIYQLLPYFEDSFKLSAKEKIDICCFDFLRQELIDYSNKVSIISSEPELQELKNFEKLIPNELSQELSFKLSEELREIIVKNSSQDFVIFLWLKGYVSSTPWEKLYQEFSQQWLDSETNVLDKIELLNKLNPNDRWTIIKFYCDKFKWVETLKLVENFVTKSSQNLRFNSGNSFSDKLHNNLFWQESEHHDLILKLKQELDSISDKEEAWELFKLGFLSTIPENILREHFNELDEKLCSQLFSNEQFSQDLIKEIITYKFNNSETIQYPWLYDLAKTHLNPEEFHNRDLEVIRTISSNEHFKLWEQGKSTILPREYISELINETPDNLSQFEIWVNKGLADKKDLSELLIKQLKHFGEINNRMKFLQVSLSVRWIFENYNESVVAIRNIGNEFIDVILWFLGEDSVFNFDILKGKFIYFSPTEQVRIIKKLFFLKAEGLFDLTINKLQELTRFDLDLYNLNSEFNQEVLVDISTEVVIQALSSFAQNKKFIVESDILKIVLKDLENDRTRRFRLENYFENCLGRTTAKFDWSRNGEIRKIAKEGNTFSFEIEFEYDPEIVDKIRLIPGRQWNSEFKKWIVPASSENALIEFAKENKFYLDFDGNNYANNTHFASFNRVERPSGISFCEGRQANQPDNLFNKTFWWCANQPCFERCESIHNSNDWENYTLLDFCEILSLNTDEINRMNDFIEKGLYYQFIGLANRFNRLLDKLYCTDCDEILFPVDHAHFAAYGVVRFHCVNQKCNNNDEVYLNHCLNGKCGNIIDSRISSKCENGLFICDSCGSCCSHSMLSRRLDNLINVGGYVHSNLQNAVEWKLGHLERAEYFCHKCSNLMDETGEDVFQCLSCNVTYDTAKYRLKRIYKGFPKGNIAIDGSSGKDDEQF